MKTLKEIYKALSIGEISQQQALLAIKCLKDPNAEDLGMKQEKILSEEGIPSGYLDKLICSPSWVSMDINRNSLGGSSQTTLSDPRRFILLADFEKFSQETAASLNVDQFDCIKAPVKNHENSSAKTILENIDQFYQQVALYCFNVFKQWVSEKSNDTKILQFVVEEESAFADFASGIVALFKTMTLENPHFRGQLLIMNKNVSREDFLTRLSTESYSGESSIKYSTGQRYVARLQSVEFDKKSPTSPYKEDGVYLITGGLGAIGTAFANEILSKTQFSRVIVSGRSSLTKNKDLLNQKFSGHPRITYRTLSFENETLVFETIKEIEREFGKLNGVLHCAGATADNFVLKKTEREFLNVLTPKVLATTWLDRATQTMDLDFMLLFSSMASYVGNIGQSDYATANGYLDAFAKVRNRVVEKGERKGFTAAIAWPLWAAGGMEIAAVKIEEEKQNQGIVPMRTETGFEFFNRCLQMRLEQALVLEGNLEKMQKAYLQKDAHLEDQGSVLDTSESRKSLDQGQPTITKYTPAQEVKSVVAKSREVDMNSNSGQSIEQKMRQYLVSVLSRLLKLPENRIDPKAALENYGIDSILAMSLTTELEKSFGSLSKTLFFEYQTIEELSEYFIKAHRETLTNKLGVDSSGNARNDKQATEKKLNTSPTDAASAVIKNFGKDFFSAKVNKKTGSGFLHKSNSALFTHQASESIAIVGLSGCYPQANSIDQFWQNLKEGVDCIIEVPKSRWDWQEYYTEDRNQDGHYSKWGGFISGVDEFDPRFFNIAPSEAASIDPQERLFLQHAWMAMEDAGHTRESLHLKNNPQGLGGQVGVYVGVMYGEYSLSGTLASIANRVSYFLNIHGPSMTLDTMCSSSLTAIHLACQDLKLGRTDMGIAGGVNISVHPNKYLMLSREQFISTDGHCQSFGEGGDGYIPGEGVGVVLLKRLSDAEKYGNHIYGIIRASVLNHGGKTNGYTVPNPKAQADVIRAALAEANIDPSSITYIEAHGTGTKLGDPIEIAALSKAFSVTQTPGVCLIGSVKSNIGHCESAAGIAGLTKVLLQMKYKKIVPSLHSGRLNPHIEFDKTPFVVNQTLTDWHKPIVNGEEMPRFAGISSFGAGGSNAHLIIEEYENRVLVSSGIEFQRNEYLIPLSARNEKQLRIKAGELAKYIESHQLNNLDPLAYSLQIGREAMDERVAFIAKSVTSLVALLNLFASGDQKNIDIFHHNIRKHRDELLAEDIGQSQISEWIQQSESHKILNYWTKGLEIDWNQFYGDRKPGLINLPVYPFAKESYWSNPISAFYNNETGLGKLAGVEEMQETVARLHPLVHHNTSDFDLQSYSSFFHRQEFFISDFHVNGHAALPFSCYFEMAYAAFEQAEKPTDLLKTVAITHCVWNQPLEPKENSVVSIALIEIDKSNAEFEIYSQQNDENIIYCQGSIRNIDAKPQQKIDINLLQNRLATIEVGVWYDHFKKCGLEYGKSFQVIQQLSLGSNEAFAIIRLPRTLVANLNQFMLHPSLLEGAFQVAQILSFQQTGQLHLSFELAAMTVNFACAEEMVVWVRNSATHNNGAAISFDINLCNVSGLSCVEIRGVQMTQVFQQEMKILDEEKSIEHPTINAVHSVPLTLPSAVQNTKTSNEVVSSSLVRSVAGSFNNPIEKISLATHKSEIVLGVEVPFSSMPLSSKQADIDVQFADLHSVSAEALIRQKRQLVPPTELTIDGLNLSRKKISLLSVDKKKTVLNSSQSNVHLYDHGQGLYSIQIVSCQDYPDFIRTLDVALEKLKTLMAKTVVLRSSVDDFISGGRHELNQLIESSVLQKLFELPAVTILEANRSLNPLSFMLASICDFIWCGENVTLRIIDQSLSYSTAETSLLDARYGASLCHRLLMESVLSGNDLKRFGWKGQVVSDNNLLSSLENFVQTIIEKPLTALHLLKAHLATPMKAIIGELASEIRPNLNSSSEFTVVKVISEPEKKTSTIGNVAIDEIGEQTYSITFLKRGKPKSNSQLIKDFIKVLNHLSKEKHPCALLWTSQYDSFFPEIHFTADEVKTIFSALARIECPLVTLANKKTMGVALSFALMSDWVIYQSGSDYEFGNLVQFGVNQQIMYSLLSLFFDADVCRQLLFSGNGKIAGLTNAILKSHGYTVADETKVLEAATEKTLQLAGHSHFYTQYKGTRYFTLLPLLAEIGVSRINQNPSPQLSGKNESVIVELASRVIRAEATEDGVLVVRFEDRNAKNMFSDEFVSGVNEVFDHVESSNSYKVIVLLGYDNYFSAGGTKEGLIAIQEGKGKFTDVKIYELPLTCKVPVIAAMQGHAIGAGWSLGMFADFAFFSEESQYLSPYMGYGFTPGAGSTFILPEKLGLDLARESLICAREMSGKYLNERNLPFKVIPRVNVESEALQLAHDMAVADRTALIELKSFWNKNIQAQLPSIYEQELEMHEKTFVGSGEALERIQTRFTSREPLSPAAHHQSLASSRSINTQTMNTSDLMVVAQKQNVNRRATIELSTIKDELCSLLAEELHLDVNEIEDNIQFVDLGLDSITGVTLIRKINARYGIDIEATKVYSYPTLQKLSEYIVIEVIALDEQQFGAGDNNLNGTGHHQNESVASDLHSNFMDYPQVSTFTGSAESKKPVSIVTQTAEFSPSINNVLEKLRQLLASELHLDESEIEENTEFVVLGLDSITGVTWIRKVNAEYNTSVEATKVYSYPTLRKLTDYLVEEIRSSQSFVTNTTEIPENDFDKTANFRHVIPSDILLPNPQSKSDDNKKIIFPTLMLKSRQGMPSLRQSAGHKSFAAEPIAVIGMAANLPQANNVEEFWQNIAEGKNCISQISDSRWDSNLYYQEGSIAPGKTYSRCAGTIEGYDKFDPGFFAISPREAMNMDPQQRIFLECCWHAIENAAYSSQALSGSRCGVFVGVASGDYHLLTREQQISAQGFTGVATSILAARISYILNLQGPCLSIDTACSSSLVAIANACDSLVNGASDLALAGGVYVMSSPDMHIKTSQSGMLSVDGNCYTFDQRANGFVPGEGVGVVMLKRLKDAERDQDIIYATLEGWGINQDGKTNGITAPNAEAQKMLLQYVYDKFDINPKDIQLIEAHGTGTKLGDPIEIEGLKEAFKKYVQEKAFCALGSVKSNIGHCLTAAGVSGVIKILQALKHRQLPPTINFSNLNEHITLENSPFFVNTTLKEWAIDAGSKRQAAISSFGFSGTNAHLVLAEYNPQTKIDFVVDCANQNGKFMLPLSARTDEQLIQKARDLLQFFKVHDDLDFASLAYTLQIARDPMEERLGIMAENLDDFINKLERFVAGEKDKTIFRNNVTDNKQAISIISKDDDMKVLVDNWVANVRLAKLLELWSKGFNFDWRNLYGEYRPQRISLPGYPFARERYWIEAKVKTTWADMQQAVLHPLVHRNTSDLYQQSFYTKFDGQESFLICRQPGEKLLSELHMLEMLRAATAFSMGDAVVEKIVYLTDIVWGGSALVNENYHFGIAVLSSQAQQNKVEIYRTAGQNDLNDEVLCQAKAHLKSIDDLNISLSASMTADMHLEEKDLEIPGVQKYFVGQSNNLYELSLTFASDHYSSGVLNTLMLEKLLLLCAHRVSVEATSLIPNRIDSVLLGDLTGRNLKVLIREITPLGYFGVRDFDYFNFDIYVVDENNCVCCQIRNMECVLVDSDAFAHSDIAVHIETQTHAVQPLVEGITLFSSVSGQEEFFTGIVNEECVSTSSKQSGDWNFPLEIKFDLALTPFAHQAPKQNDLMLQSWMLPAGWIHATSIPKITLMPLTDILDTVVNMAVQADQLTGANTAAGFSDLARPKIKLLSTQYGTEVINSQACQSVKLYSLGRDIYKITIQDNAKNLLTADLVNSLVAALQFISRQENAKLLLIDSEGSDWLNGGVASHNLAVASGLYHVLESLECVVIAYANGNATGVGFIVASACDFLITNPASDYGLADDLLAMDETIVNFLAERFSRHFVHHLVAENKTLVGAELQKKSWPVACVSGDEAEAYLLQLVNALIPKSKISLSLLKKHLARNLRKYMTGFSHIARREMIVNVPINISNLDSIDLGSLVIVEIHDAVFHVHFVKPSEQNDSLNFLRQAYQCLQKLSLLLHAQGDGVSLLLSSECNAFICELTTDHLIHFGSEQVNILLEIQQLILDMPVAVVAILNQATNAFGMILAESADKVIYSQNISLTTDDVWRHPVLAVLATHIFDVKLGERARALYVSGQKFNSDELGAVLPYCLVLDENKVLAKGQAIAQHFSKTQKLNRTGIKLMTDSIRHRLKDLAIFDEQNMRLLNSVQEESLVNSTERDASALQGVAVQLKSSVIKAFSYKNGVIEVRMEDKDAKNMFSDAFLDGMFEVFAHIAESKDYKVVVLTGYDTYFSSGGTKEGLLAIQEGKYKFTERKVFQLAFDCQLPVIAAMQGHGVGAGWALGVYADIQLMSEESRYISPYMNYGFTPGAGATFIFPTRIGYDLARETMLTASEFSGRDLKARNIAIDILPRTHVRERAFNIATQFARLSRYELIQIKHCWNLGLKTSLDAVLPLELEMHEKTFVGQTNTLQQIQNQFNHHEKKVGVDTASTAPSSRQIDAVKNNDYQVATRSAKEEEIQLTLTETIKILRSYLAQELQMDENGIKKDRQFTDLGVDSIIGVSLVNKINMKFKTHIDATKVYAYPTLTELAQHIIDERPTLLGQQSTESFSNSLSSSADFAVKVAHEKIEKVVTKVVSAQSHMSQLRTMLAKELQMDEKAIGKDKQFIDLGLDSIIGVSWVNEINRRLGTRVEATSVYSHPTLGEFSLFVEDEAKKCGSVIADLVTESAPIKVESHSSILGSVLDNDRVNHYVSSQEFAQPRTPLVKQPSAPISNIRLALTSWRVQKKKQKASSFSLQEIAVIGMAGQFPKANNLESFWKNIAEGNDCIEKIPKSRWDVERYYQPIKSNGSVKPGKITSQWMGLLEEYDLFDPLFFNISPIDAEDMDPQQRVFMQTCWQTIENAAYDPKRLSGSRCGVFVGCGTGDYHTYGQGLGGSVSILAARISYFLNLQGPCISIDTACSSSLVAIANACDSLSSGASDIALAGGVNVMSGPAMQIGTSQAGMLSVDGRCFTFDQRANGFVSGEGVGVVLLKRLKEAVEDRDIILGVVEGWGVNQDGKTNGITAPNPKSQTRLQREVYDKFDINPANIQLIEAHGTGTKLGDPIEIEGLKESFKHYTNQSAFCAVGSVKSNIGHCLFAAGISGFIKLLLAFEHKQLPPSANFSKLNEHINLDNSPFFVNTSLRPWQVKTGEYRCAAISSFGFSGTNAHLVLREPVGQEVLTSGRQEKYTGIYLVPLSAKTDEQLRERAADLIQHIQSHDDELVDIAFTLQVGREAMSHRLVLLADNLDSLVYELKTYLNNKNSMHRFVGVVHDDDLDSVVPLITSVDRAHLNGSHLIELAKTWVLGTEVEWSSLYQQTLPARIVLPGYPFAKTRYWKSDEEEFVQSTHPTVAVDEEFLTSVFDQLESDSLDFIEGIRLIKQLV